MRQQNAKQPAYRMVWAVSKWDALGRCRLRGIFRDQLGVAILLASYDTLSDRQGRPLVLVRKLKESNVTRLYGPKARVQ